MSLISTSWRTAMQFVLTQWYSDFHEWDFSTRLTKVANFLYLWISGQVSCIRTISSSSSGMRLRTNRISRFRIRQTLRCLATVSAGWPSRWTLSTPSRLSDTCIWAASRRMSTSSTYRSWITCSPAHLLIRRRRFKLSRLSIERGCGHSEGRMTGDSSSSLYLQARSRRKKGKIQ